jgi:uncharacterized membrane protein
MPRGHLDSATTPVMDAGIAVSTGVPLSSGRGVDQWPSYESNGTPRFWLCSACDSAFLRSLVNFEGSAEDIVDTTHGSWGSVAVGSFASHVGPSGQPWSFQTVLGTFRHKKMNELIGPDGLQYLTFGAVRGRRANRSTLAPQRSALNCTRSSRVIGYVDPRHRQAYATIDVMERSAWQSNWHKHPGVRHGDQLSLGERSADRMRNVMGSWPFVFSFFAIMILWALVNTLLFEHILHHKAFDPYPYILLNLFLSMLAGVQAAALLIAAKRADAISSEVAIHTANNTDDIKKLIAENTALTEAMKKNTDLLDEIHLHVANIGKTLGADMGRFEPKLKPQSSD